jgi:nitrite reductase (NADH) small subunit
MIRVSVGPVERIPVGEGREVVVGDRTLAVFRARSGEVYATQATCPHREGPLAEGLLGGTTLVCPLHGYKFDVATGAPVGAGNGCPALRTYAASVDDTGTLVVDVPDEGCA